MSNINDMPMENKIKYPRIIQIIPAMPNLCMRYTTSKQKDLQYSPVVCMALVELLDTDGNLYRQVMALDLPQDEPVALFSENSGDRTFRGFEFLSEPLERSE